MNGQAKVAQQQIRSFVERVENLDEEIKALNSDKSDVFAEAKSQGFDPKVLKEIIRKRRKDPGEREEFDAMVDLYWNALVLTDPSRAHAKEAA